MRLVLAFDDTSLAAQLMAACSSPGVFWCKAQVKMRLAFRLPEAEMIQHQDPKANLHDFDEYALQ